MIDNKDLWIKRADELIARGHSARHENVSEQVQFATSMLTALYGAQSTQLRVFIEGQNQLSRARQGISAVTNSDHALGAIKNAKAELEAGLIARVRVLVAGEMLAELVRLGKEILETNTEEAKNVAAVLVAAAYEDLIRRMGEEFASVSGRPKLEDVVNALKTAGVLKGGEVTVALGFLKFRNDSLHAHWINVSRAQVESCVAFVEGLIVEHFSGR
jgi:hypothetical protein